MNQKMKNFIIFGRVILRGESMKEFELKSREEALVNLKEMFYLQRITKKDMEEKVQAFLWFLNIDGFNNGITERRLDEVLKAEGLGRKDGEIFNGYWDY